MANVVKHADLLLVQVWWFTRRQLHNEYAERPHVHLVVVALFTFYHFGCHPAHSTHFASAIHVIFCQLSCIPKISQLNFTCLRHQDIVRLDVSVQNVTIVQISQSLQHLIANVFTELLAVFTVYLLKHRGQSATIHKLQEYPEAALEVKTLVALYHAIVLLAHQHDADFV